MTARDRTVLLAFVSLVVLAASWFLLLSPARKDLAAAEERVVATQARLTAAQASVASGASARAAYEDDYAEVSRLGKAVPADDDVPSLVVQLEGAAKRSRVDFRSIELSAAAGAAAPAAPTQAAAAASAGGAAPAGAAPAADAPSAAPAPATQAAASTLPPGATVGAAGFPTMPFDFSFSGRFFQLQEFLGRLDDFTRVAGKRIDVRGRLLTVDGFSLTPSPKGLPRMDASVHATAYLLPADQAAGVPATPAPATAALPASTPTAEAAP